jgi:pyrroline-5-carboxylate reductase
MKKTKWLAPRVLKIGLIGCGAIGTGLALEIQKRFPKTARLAYVCDVDVSRAEMLLRRLKIKPSLVSGADLIKKAILLWKRPARTFLFRWPSTLCDIINK